MLLTRDRIPSKAPFLLQCLDFSNSGGGRYDNGIEDKTILESLDFPHHLSLIFGGAIVMDNAQSSQESHVYGHRVLGDSVHRRRQERGFESDSLCDGGV